MAVIAWDILRVVDHPNNEPHPQKRHFLTERMNAMRDLSWNVFTITGDVDAYLLYKEFDETSRSEETENDDPGDEDRQDS